MTGEDIDPERQERPEVHPEPSVVEPCELVTDEDSELMCRRACGRPARQMPPTPRLCGPCQVIYFDEIRDRVMERDRVEAERRTGVGIIYAAAYRWPEPYMWVECDRCSYRWVGVDREYCPGCRRRLDDMTKSSRR